MSEVRYIAPEVELARRHAIPSLKYEQPPMRRFLFSVVTVPGGAQLVEVLARDVFQAFLELPDDVVSWDFARYPDGSWWQSLTILGDVA